MEQTVSNYTLLRLLGRGGMGSVYEARHTTIERRAAIKILHREFCEDADVLKRFQNEARAVNIIGHPGLVSVSEFGQTTEGAPYIVMEYIDGITLRERMQRAGGRLPAEVVVRLSRQIASTLAAAHSKQIVHRDLKPVNIMLTTDPEDGSQDRVKVLDFGIAKLATETTSQTKSGILMGTPTYMAPEQCRSGRNAVDRSDVYALGIIMYEMLSGDTPFRGGPAVVMAAHLMQEPAPLAKAAPGAPPELCALIHRMLAKTPADRPHAAEVARALAAPSGQFAPSPQAILASAPRSPAQDPDQATVLQRPEPPQGSLLSAVPIGVRGKLIGAAALGVLVLGLASGIAVLVMTGQSENPAAHADLGSPRSADPDLAEAHDAGSPATRAENPARTTPPTAPTTKPEGTPKKPDPPSGKNSRGGARSKGGGKGARSGSKGAKGSGKSGPRRSTR